MALKKETLARIAANLKIKESDLIDALSKPEEVDLTIPEITVFTAEELETRDNNMKTTGKKEGEKEGEIKGKELAAKSLKKKFGIEGDEKDLDKVVDAVNAKTATGDEGLKQQVQSLLKDKENLLTDLNAEKLKADTANFDVSLIGMFPKNRISSLKDNELLTLIKSELSFEKTETGTVVKRNGDVVKHPQTHAPLPLSDVISGYFDERKWISEEEGGGRGGGPAPAGGGKGIKTFSQAQTEWLKQNPDGNVMSPEFTEYVGEISKADPTFDMYK